MFIRIQFAFLSLIVFFNSNVDGRFRRLSGSSGLSSPGGWRLMTPSYTRLDYPESSNSYSKASTYKRHQSLVPIRLDYQWRLPFHSNQHRFNYHLDPNSAEYELRSTISSSNQHGKSDEPSRFNGDNQFEPSAAMEDEVSITTEKISKAQINRPSSSLSNERLIDGKSGMKKIKLNDTKKLETNKLNISLETSVPLEYQPQRFAFMKKAAIESIEGSTPTLHHYRSSTHGSKHSASSSISDLYFVAIVVGSSGIAIFSVIGAGYCFYRFQQHNKSAADVDYPAYGVVGPITKETINSGNISPIGDRKLAQSAQMYHYHHQKQQMIASEKVTASRHTSASDVDSEEENEEGDYTVYECPGLASTGEMEVKNPLFQDDITPVSSPSVVNSGESKDKK